MPSSRKSEQIFPARSDTRKAPCMSGVDSCPILLGSLKTQLLIFFTFRPKAILHWCLYLVSPTPTSHAFNSLPTNGQNISQCKSLHAQYREGNKWCFSHDRQISSEPTSVNSPIRNAKMCDLVSALVQRQRHRRKKTQVFTLCSHFSEESRCRKDRLLFLWEYLTASSSSWWFQVWVVVNSAKKLLSLRNEAEFHAEMGDCDWLPETDF